MKTEKYGSKILEEIKRYESKNEFEDENDHGSSSAKRLKSKKALVVVESSEDDAWKDVRFPSYSVSEHCY